MLPGREWNINPPSPHISFYITERKRPNHRMPRCGIEASNSTFDSLMTRGAKIRRHLSGKQESLKSGCENVLHHFHCAACETNWCGGPTVKTYHQQTTTNVRLHGIERCCSQGSARTWISAEGEATFNVSERDAMAHMSARSVTAWVKRTFNR